MGDVVLISERVIRRIVVEELVRQRRKNLVERGEVNVAVVLERGAAIALLTALKDINKFKAFTMNQLIDYVTMNTGIFLNIVTPVINSLTGKNIPSGDDLIDALHKLANLLAANDRINDNLDKSIEYLRSLPIVEYNEAMEDNSDDTGSEEF